MSLPSTHKTRLISNEGVVREKKIHGRYIIKSEFTLKQPTLEIGHQKFWRLKHSQKWTDRTFWTIRSNKQAFSRWNDALPVFMLSLYFMKISCVFCSNTARNEKHRETRETFAWKNMELLSHWVERIRLDERDHTQRNGYNLPSTLMIKPVSLHRTHFILFDRIH